MGDVVGIVDGSGTQVVSYTYSAWGELLATTGTLATTLGFYTPLRQETSLYYLQSRYYDPALGRFLNADAYAATGQGLLGNNMFAYCHNNPVIYIDPSGFIIVLADPTEEQRAEYERVIAYLKNLKQEEASHRGNRPLLIC